MIAKILELIGVKNKWSVEFGAWDGKYLPNTWDLINNQGWSAVLIEGEEKRANRLSELHAARAGEVFVQNAFVGWEGPQRLDALLASSPVPRDFDLLSIDIDGNDWHVWAGLKDYRPA